MLAGARKIGPEGGIRWRPKTQPRCLPSLSVDQVYLEVYSLQLRDRGVGHGPDPVSCQLSRTGSISLKSWERGETFAPPDIVPVFARRPLIKTQTRKEKILASRF
jgi:hypothetical protein